MVDLTSIAIGVVIGVVVGAIPALLTQTLGGIQQHREARYQFYRDKSNVLSSYVAAMEQMLGDLGDFGVSIGVMPHTVSFLPPADPEPTQEQLQARLDQRLIDLNSQFDKLENDGTLVLLPRAIVEAMWDMDRQVQIIRSNTKNTTDLKAYFLKNPRLLESLIVGSLKSSEIVRVRMQRELGLERVKPVLGSS